MKAHEEFDAARHGSAHEQGQRGQPSRCTRAAQWYAQHRGWRVLPLHTATTDGGCTCGRPDCKSAAKHPRTPRGVSDATTDPETIAAWWQRWPNANVGIATGPESGLVVLDVDPRHGGDDTLAELESQHGKLPNTVEAITGGGGRHIFFAHPRTHVPNSAGHVGPGLDVRGSGGYVVAPPSVHASGRTYEWEGSSRPDQATVAAPPPWLLSKLAPQSVRERQGQSPLDGWRTFFAEPWPEGQRNDRVARAAGYLLSHGIDPCVTLDLITYTNQSCGRPPLEHEEVARTVMSI